ncbi:MAG: heat-inducible transcriptional repressor HrcA [Holophagaceae bacterium]|jgi:heat-inducible transcriptional repressor
MSQEPPLSLSARRESILRTLIETYYREKEPVGSKLLAERHGESLSSATIRSVLSDLEHDALLTQPHTSAGRIPTERAYRYYVDRWLDEFMSKRPNPSTKQDLQALLQMPETDLEPWAQRASRILSEVLGGVCVALPSRMVLSTLVKLEFVPLGSEKIVAIWVDNQGEVEHRVIENQWHYAPHQLVEMGNFATTHFRGLTLSQMQKKMMEGMGEGVHEVKALLAQLQMIARDWEDHTSNNPSTVVVQGLSQLTRLPEFEDLDRLKHLVENFEEQSRLAHLLNAFAEKASKDTQVILGSENPYFSNLGLATSVRRVQLDPLGHVTLALIAPLRMDYPHVLGGLSWWANELNHRPHS